MEHTPPASHVSAPPTAPRTWPPLLMLLGVLLFVTFGGFFFTGVPSGVVEPALERRVRVGDGMSLRIASEWEVAARDENPASVLVSSPAGSLLAVLPGTYASPEDLVDMYVAEFLDPQSSRLTVGEPTPIEFTDGRAVVASYSGIFDGAAGALEGEIIAMTGSISGTGILDGWASEDMYAAVRPAIRAMARSVEIS